MKQILFIGLLLSAWCAHGQTELYKKYAHWPGVHAYCVRDYPLGGVDTTCVTLFSTGDSAVYQALKKELCSLPFTPRKQQANIPRPNDIVPTGAARDRQNTVSRPPVRKKSLEMRGADGLPGEDGMYLMCYPSDRMVILVFLIHNSEEQLKVMSHMIDTELN